MKNEMKNYSELRTEMQAVLQKVITQLRVLFKRKLFCLKRLCSNGSILDVFVKGFIVLRI